MLKRMKWLCGGGWIVLVVLMVVPAMATTWQQIGGPQGGNIRALVIDPKNTQLMYAGSYGSGVFKSTDGGSSWHACNNGISPNNSYVTSLILDPQNTQVLYAGISSLSNSGVFKSTDGGSTWNPVNTGLSNTNITFLVLDTQNTQTLYALVQGNGLVKSTNGGGSWSSINSGLPSNVLNLAIDPVNAQTLYAGTSGSLFKSTDGGNSWQPLNGAWASMSLAIDSSSTVYAGTNNGVFKSTDGGASWSNTTSGQTNRYIRTVAIDPNDNRTIYAAAGTGGNLTILKSSDAGASWIPVTSGVDTSVDIYSLAVTPGNSQTIFAGSYVGIFKSTDNGSSWNQSNRGVYPVDLSLTVDATDQQTVYVGTYSGIFKSTNGGSSWQGVNRGLYGNEGVYVLTLDPRDNKTLYAGTYGGYGLYKSSDGGNSWSFISSPARNVRGIAISADSQTIFVGTYGNGVYRSGDGGKTWSTVNNGLTSRNVWSILLDPSNSQTAYVGTYDAGAFKTTDGGASWIWMGNGLPATHVSRLFNDPIRTATIYAGTSSGVFKSTDSGSSWTMMNNGLSTQSSTALIIDPESNQTLYTGSPSGVFISLNAGDSWTSFNTGLTGLSIKTMAIGRGPSRIIYAGTVDGGLFSCSPVPPGSYDGLKAGTVFDVLRSEGGGPFITVLSKRTSTSYVDTSLLKPNTIYQYAVTSDIDPTPTIFMTTHTPLYNGWNVVGVPYNTAGVSPNTFFASPVSSVYQWIPTAANMESDTTQNGSYSTVTALAPANGYFVKASNSSTLLTYAGNTVTLPINVTLKPGWTLITNPIANNLTNIGTNWLIDGQPLSTSVTNGTLGGSLYWWNGITYDFWSISSNPIIEPWKGYWIVNQTSSNHTLTIQ